MLDRPDLEDHREEGDPIGQCEYCGDDIMPFDDYYDLEYVLLHDECGLDYLHQFRKYA